MNISLLNILRTVSWDFRRDMAQGYANALRNAIELHIENDVEKREGFFLSKKGYTSKEDNLVHGANFKDRLYVGDIYRIEKHLYWNDEELADDDEIINVVCIDGPVTRDGGACSYGSKDWRDQVMYANTIPQVIGHIFVVNTPGGESACRNDYDLMIADCRKNNRPTVTFVDGMDCSSGVNLSCRTDRTIVMNPKDEVGCIGSMAAFWATPDGAKDIDGSRYIEIVGNESPDKNGWYRDAANGDYEKLQALIDKDTNEFHQTVRENRPLVEDWMLTGDTFKAEELMPGLVDEIGDFNRAIECVQLLAAGQLPLARDAKKEEAPAEPTEPEAPKAPKPEPEVPEGPEDEPEVSSNEAGQQNEMSKLNEQQKAAISARPGTTKIVENGHVKEVVETPFGSIAHEIAKPQNHNNMTDEEKKKAQQTNEAAEEPQTDPNKKEDDPNKNDPNGNPEADPNEKKPDENPEGEPENEPNGEPDVNPEENPGGEEPAEEPEEPETEPGGEPEAEPEGEPDENPDDPKKKKEDDPDEKCGGGEPKKDDNDNDACDPNKKSEGADELAHTKDALHTAKNMLADRDKTIKELMDSVAALKKQVNDLRGEVKELAAEPSPMTDESAGVPKDNGTGAVETGAVKSIVNANMSADEIRQRLRKQDKELADKRRHR